MNRYLIRDPDGFGYVTVGQFIGSLLVGVGGAIALLLVVITTIAWGVPQ